MITIAENFFWPVLDDDDGVDDYENRKWYIYMSRMSRKYSKWPRLASDNDVDAWQNRNNTHTQHFYTGKQHGTCKKENNVLWYEI